MPASPDTRPPEKSKPFRDVPYHIHRQIVEYLDIADRWRRIVDVMPTNSYRTEQVERFAMAINRTGGSPANELLIDMGIRGFTVEQVVSYLRRNCYEPALMLLLPKEHVKITSQPRSVVCSVGGEIMLEVKAVGLPFPRFQWYNRKKEMIPNGCDSILRIPKARPCDNGAYCVFVCNDLNHVFSEWCQVKVTERMGPVEPGYGPRPPQPPPPPFEPPCITLQPEPRLDNHVGDMIKIRCSATGPKPVQYEWHMNGQDTPPIKSTSHSLVIHSAKVEDSGKYRCKVTFPSKPGTCLWSSDCQVNVEARRLVHVPQPMTQPRGDHDSTPAFRGPVQEQKLCGKVALVIGNQHYYGSMAPLYQAESDAAEIASLLTSIDEDFRVISLINLTGHEMNAAITYFISLLHAGIYGVFYFAGHGFEFNGETYLLPVDFGLENSSEQCMRALDVLYRMQTQRAKLSFMILDVCRTEYPQAMPPKAHAPRSNEGNYIVAHSCCSQHMAFERRSEQNGIYMSHLKKYLADNEKVEDVLSKVAKSIADSSRETIQRSAYETTTVEYMSLHDKIQYDDVPAHKLYARLYDSWKQSHQVPQCEEPLYNTHGVKVTLSFQAEFSNVLIVCLHADIENRQDVEQLSIAVEVVGEDAEAVSIEDLTEKKGSKDAFKQVTNLHVRPKLNAPWSYRICDIQKLRKNLCLLFKIRYTYRRAIWEEEEQLVFSAPLVANLNLRSSQSAANPPPSE